MNHRSATFGSVLAGLALMLVLAGCGGEKYVPKTGGSEVYQKQVQEGKPLYTPPRGALPPGAGGAPR